MTNTLTTWPAFERALSEFNRKHNVDWKSIELQDNTAQSIAERAFEIDWHDHFDTTLHHASLIAAERILSEMLREANGERQRITGNELASIIYQVMRDQREL